MQCATTPARAARSATTTSYCSTGGTSTSASKRTSWACLELRRVNTFTWATTNWKHFLAGGAKISSLNSPMRHGPVSCEFAVLLPAVHVHHSSHGYCSTSARVSFLCAHIGNSGPPNMNSKAIKQGIWALRTGNSWKFAPPRTGNRKFRVPQQEIRGPLTGN